MDYSVQEIKDWLKRIGKTENGLLKNASLQRVR